ncbi:MAG TPA: sigma-54 dependent transcriptional regulator [Terriglobia bacterium]|nr:sigma-54 dependent transcriptional regulator [Terriglobia bacterium]
MYRNQSKRVLLIDHDEAFGPLLGEVLGEGFILTHLLKPAEAVPVLEKEEADVVLLNWDFPDPDAAKNPARDLLKVASALPTAPAVIVFSWDAARKTAMEATRCGAADFFAQPLLIPELRVAIDRAQQRVALARELTAAQRVIAGKYVEGLLGNSKPMDRVRELVHKVANVLTTVLITGESGTGKEVVAHAIHQLSLRAKKPFVAFSACALPESLIEDELFGHEKGAYTGATQLRRGRFEEAQGGTIFLDEIGDLALPLQAKLLRVLQERKMERLGSNTPIPLDVRVICATNRNLEKMIQEGTFRQDLYFRISPIKTELPALRERVDDIAVLADHFLRAFVLTHQKSLRGFTPGYLSALAGYNWPGNVRQLQNVIESSVVLADGMRLGVEDLPPELGRMAASSEIVKGSFHESVKSFKREIIRSALRVHNGNKLKAAQELQISRCYLHRLVNLLSIEEEVALEQNAGVEDDLALTGEPIDSKRIQ